MCVCVCVSKRVLKAVRRTINKNKDNQAALILNFFSEFFPNTSIVEAIVLKVLSQKLMDVRCRNLCDTFNFRLQKFWEIIR